MSEDQDEAEYQGSEARRNGLPKSDNSYTSVILRAAWNTGWDRQDRIMEIAFQHRLTGDSR